MVVKLLIQIVGSYDLNLEKDPTYAGMASQ